MNTLSRRMRCWLSGAVIGAMVVAPIMQMLFDRRAVLTLDARQSFVSPDPAHGGDEIAITWRVIPHRNCAGLVIPRIIDSTGRVFEFAHSPTVYQDIMSTDGRSFTKYLTLPLGIAPGTARYQAVIKRWCNVFQEYVWQMTDDPFPLPFEVDAPFGDLVGPRGKKGEQGLPGEAGPRGERGLMGPSGN